MTPYDFWKITILCRAYATKLTGGGTYRAKNRNRKTDNSTFKLQSDIYRRSKRIHKKWNDSPHIFGCILNIRTRGNKNSRWIFLLGPKFNTLIQAMPPENGPVHI